MAQIANRTAANWLSEPFLFSMMSFRTARKLKPLQIQGNLVPATSLPCWTSSSSSTPGIAKGKAHSETITRNRCRRTKPKAQWEPCLCLTCTLGVSIIVM